jgi:ribosome maturation factor RimP
VQNSEGGDSVPSFISGGFGMNESTLRQLIDKWTEENDCFLVDLKVSTSQIQVFIDSLSGVSISSCTALNRYLQSELEGTNVLETHGLEVSSPGIDYPFKVKKQYLKAKGRSVKIVLKDGKEMNGEITEIKEEGVVVKELLKEKVGKKKVIKENYTEVNFENIREAKEQLIFKK